MHMKKIPMQERSSSEKQARQQHLLKLLKKEAFGSQEEVVAAMHAAGFEVTQSSVSRDFRELGILKLGSRYAAPEVLSHGTTPATLQRMIRGYDAAGPHLFVVKTSPGAASIIAEEIDQRGVAGVVGTIAGENTIFVATTSRETQERIVNLLRQFS